MLSAPERRRALRAFKQRGIVVHVGALENLHAAYQNTHVGTFPQFLDKAFDLLSRPDGAKDGILTKSLAKSIGSRLERDTLRHDGNIDAALEVIDVFSVPRWKPNVSTSRTSISSASKLQAPSGAIIDAPASAKSDMFRLRYELILSRTLRNKTFKPPLSGIASVNRKTDYYELSGIESLQAGQGEKLVLGMLTQLEEGVWFLEDINGSVRLDLSQADVTPGLHTDGSFVIVQGVLVEEEGTDPTFAASVMGTPPHESREETIENLGREASLFGGQLDTSMAESLIQMEKEAADSVFLFLSDVAVDNPKVLAGLRHLFQGYLEDEVVPTLIVLMGNFLSHPFGQKVDDVKSLQDGFARLGNMLKSDFAPLVKSSTFVLVPSTTDAGPGNILPRPALPKMFTKRFMEALDSDKVYSASNPCRIRYMTQELVVLRDNILQKMVRHCSIKPDFSETGLICEHFVKTITDQSYLSPLPLTARPVLWAHQHALWLFPTPHVIVTADKVDGFICRYGGALGLNPGSFVTDFSFQIYLPAERRAQQCSLNSEDVEANEPVDKTEQKDKTAETPSPMENGKDSISDGAPDSDLDNRMINSSTQEQTSNTKRGTRSIRKHAVTDTEEEITEANKKIETSEEEEEEEEGEGDEEETEQLGKTNPDSDLQTYDESDDESLLVPAEGLKKIDVRALVRNALAEDTSTIGQTGEDSDEDGSQQEADD